MYRPQICQSLNSTSALPFIFDEAMDIKAIPHSTNSIYELVVDVYELWL